MAGAALTAAGPPADLALGLLSNLEHDADYYGEGVHLAAVRPGGEVALVALVTGAYPVAVVDLAGTAGAVADDLARHVVAERWPLTVVSGPAGAAEPVAAALARATGERFHLARRTRYLDLEHVDPPPPPNGRVRRATVADAALVDDWAAAFLEAIDEADSDGARLSTRNRLAAGDIWLWDHEAPVSMASVARRTPRAATVSLVYTPLAHRGHGYASAAVAALSQHLLDEGHPRCALFTDLADPTSNGIYQRLGYIPRCDFSAYTRQPAQA